MSEVIAETQGELPIPLSDGEMLREWKKRQDRDFNRNSMLSWTYCQMRIDELTLKILTANPGLNYPEPSK